MKPLKSIIVEDEKSSQKTLKNMLTDFCEGIEVNGIAGTVDDAILEIQKHTPDVIFLDIELPEKNGFHLLEYFPNANFEIIFTTAYNQYAIKAFRLSAVDYLLKPIDIEELRSAVAKVKEKKSDKDSRKKYQMLKSNISNVLNKLALPCKSGLIFVELSDIIRIEADGNYTNFHMNSGEKHVVSNLLKKYTKLLKDFNFQRINRTDLINIAHIAELKKQKRIKVRMSDGEWLNVTDSWKDDLINLFEF